MSTVIDEGLLQFEFDGRWKPILSWDCHVAYRGGIEKLNGSKAVDFIGIYDKELIYFIEVRDYRVNPRSKDEDLQTELELKVRDTVAGIVGAGRRLEHADEFEPFLKAILSRYRLIVVLWLEQPSPTPDPVPVHRRRRSAGAGIVMTQAKSRMAWLDARVINASRAIADQGLVPGLIVRGLARKPREIVKILRARKIPIDQSSLDRILKHQGGKDLETWLERAATVSSVQELFDGPP